MVETLQPPLRRPQWIWVTRRLCWLSLRLKPGDQEDVAEPEISTKQQMRKDQGRSFWVETAKDGMETG